MRSAYLKNQNKMVSLPKPSEPSTTTVAKHSKNWEDGVKSVTGTDGEIDGEILVKRGMIEFLWDKWEPYEVSYGDIQVATGELNYKIGLW